MLEAILSLGLVALLITPVFIIESPLWGTIANGALIAALLIGDASRAAEPLRGTVIHVYDGDTILVRGGPCRAMRRAGTACAIRLWGIDSPERGQPGWHKATRHMTRLALGKTATCYQKQRRLTRKRVVMQCWINGKDLAMEMRCAGLAKDWPKYSKGYYAECVK